MRKTVTSIISATALLGASALAMAAPGVPGDQSSQSHEQSSQSQLNGGTTATPNSHTGSQAAPYQNSGASTSSDATLKSGGTTGSGTSAQATDEAQVKQQLEQQGYTNVQNVRKDRTGWTAKAKKDGQQVTVNVDSSGQVKTR